MRRFHTPFAILAAIVLVQSSACGGARHHLGDYAFAGGSLATVVRDAPSPGILTGSYDLRSTDLLEVALKAGSKAVKDVEARRARARMDSAAMRLRLTDSLALRTVDRANRYLGTRPVPSSANPDFLLEVRLRDFGLDASGSGAAGLYTNAEVVLLDQRSGREIWNVRVQGSDRLTPRVRGTGDAGGSILAAGALHTMSVADFELALDELMTLSANVVTEELRTALRGSR